MDSMDYSMDNADPAHPSSSSAPRCQYQHPQPPAGGSSFSSPARDAHHYDPIHNTDSWYQIDGSAGPGRARALPGFGQWLPGQFSPSSSWSPLTEAHARLRGDMPDAAHTAGFVGTSNPGWNEMPRFDSLGYSPHTSASRGPASGGRSAAAAPSVSTSMPPGASSNASGSPTSYPRRESRSDQHSPRSTSYSESQLTIMAMRMRDAQVRASEGRSYQAQLPPSFVGADHARPTHSEDRLLGRRHAVPSWETDDDDDDGHLADSEGAAYRRHSQLFGDQDEERAMAAIRGSIAAAKKIPSKEALASLEKMDLKDLKDAEKVCTICYNDIGVENPDGVVESPIRLPNCKHIFGEKCIKKWFQDSDTCPYCRDKLPSELSLRKSAAFEGLRARQERLVAITAQSYHARQHGFPQRYPSSEELASQDRGILRYTQEEYHYIMTGSPSAESWSYTAHNRAPHRESPERRRQGRGRASFGRPISVGSARFVAPGPPVMNHQGASQRTHAPNPTPHRASSPPPLRTDGEASSSHVTGPSLSRRTSGTATTAEEPSPSVAVGSGVVPDQRSSSLGNAPQIPPPYFDHSTDGWYDMFPSHGGRTNLPPIANYRPRPMNDSSALPPLFHEQIPDGFGGPPTNPNFPPGQIDGTREGSYAHFQNRWSGQFLH